MGYGQRVHTTITSLLLVSLHSAILGLGCVDLVWIDMRRYDKITDCVLRNYCKKSRDLHHSQEERGRTTPNNLNTDRTAYTALLIHLLNYDST